MRLPSNALLLLCFAAALRGQTILDTAKYPNASALFDEPADPKSGGCDVQPLRPHLNFGFHFVSGYRGRLPIRYFAGRGRRFAVLTRVTPDDERQPPVVLSQLFQIPNLPAKSGSDLEIDGAFFVGEGSYKVDWLISDRAGNTCKKSWHIQAKPQGSDRALEATLPPGAVTPLRYEPWTGVPEDRLTAGGAPRRLTVLLHVAPLSIRGLKIHPYEETLLLSSVLSLLQRTPFTEVKLVAFNLDQQKVIFRQDRFDEDGWHKLVDAVSQLNLLTVPVSVLSRKNGHLNVLREMLTEELTAEHPADAVVVLGPGTRHDEKLKLAPPEGAAHPRIFYFSYKQYWNRGQEYPDTIGRTVRSLAGRVFFIYSPHDFFGALRELRKGLG